jgi:acyl carrier protein
MVTQPITSRIERILRKNFLIKIRKPLPKVNLVKDVQFNPMEFLEMIFYVENEFKIELQDSDLNRIHTVGDLVQCVQKYSTQ